jgi:hypothetical protein
MRPSHIIQAAGIVGGKMKKIIMSGVATLGLLGAAVAPAFAATSAAATQETAMVAGGHCKIKHWSTRAGKRDRWGIRGHWGGKDGWDGRFKRDRWRHHGDEHGFGRDHDNKFGRDHDNKFGHDDGYGVNDHGRSDDHGRDDDHGHDGEFRDHRDHDSWGRGRHSHDGRHRDRWADRGRFGRHDRWRVRNFSATEKWCRGRFPRHGIRAGGGGTWHGRSVAFALKPGQ